MSRTTTSTSTYPDFPMSFRTPLPREMIKEIIDNISHHTDLKACSLVSKDWAYPARIHLFHHVGIYPEEADDWLSRLPESIQRMAPHIVKFEFLVHCPSAPGMPLFRWDGSGGLLARLISSLADSPVRWLRIRSFGVGGFNKTTLEQCFEPICHSLRSLVLDNLVTCPDATRYLISLFPNLDNLHTGKAHSASTQLASGWVGCGTKHSPRLSGMLLFYSAASPGGAELLASVVSLSPRFRMIFPVEVTSSNWGAMRELVEACAETLESVPLVSWGLYVGTRSLSVVCFMSLITAVTGSAPRDLFSSCDTLREVGFAAWDRYRYAKIHETLSSITSKDLCTVSLQLAFSNWSLSDRAWKEFCRCWRDLENVLCHLADRRLANGQSPLVLEIIWERLAGHKGNCGMTRPGTILPKFREKGLIRFVEGKPSCNRCREILAEGSQASAGVQLSPRNR